MLLYPVKLLTIMFWMYLGIDQLYVLSQQETLVLKILIVMLNHISKCKKVDEHLLQLYKTQLDSALFNNERDKIADIHNRFDNCNKMVTSIVHISDSVLPKTKFRHFLKPYWNQQLKYLHAVMRHRHHEWIIGGRPRNNDHSSYHRYKGAKCLFRSQHRKCAQNYLNELCREIDDAAELDSAFFWKKINNSLKSKSSSTESEVEFNWQMCGDPQQIVTGWGNTLKSYILILKESILVHNLKAK